MLVALQHLVAKQISQNNDAQKDNENGQYFSSLKLLTS